MPTTVSTSFKAGPCASSTVIFRDGESTAPLASFTAALVPTQARPMYLSRRSA